MHRTHCDRRAYFANWAHWAHWAHWARIHFGIYNPEEDFVLHGFIPG
jgi:hypothetical protein